MLRKRFSETYKKLSIRVMLKKNHLLQQIMGCFAINLFNLIIKQIWANICKLPWKATFYIIPKFEAA